MLGTEPILEAVLEEFSKSRFLVSTDDKYNELEILFGHRKDLMSRLSLFQGQLHNPSVYRFVIVPRNLPTPDGFIRVRATTQRWAGHVRKEVECPILEFDETSRMCFLFYSIHSSRKEIDEFTLRVGARSVFKLFKPIEVRKESKAQLAPEKSRRERHVRRPFQFSCDSMWLDSLVDSQETVRPPMSEVTDVCLPTWGPS